MNYELPPLPASDLGTVQLASGMHQQLGHSDEAMRAYALAVARDVMRLSAQVEREACAKLCNERAAEYMRIHPTVDGWKFENMAQGAENCADAIRARRQS